MAQAGEPSPRRPHPQTHTWPDGARCAVALSFDSDHETNELRDGGLSPERLSWGAFGTRRGIPGIRAALDRHGYKASFFVPAVSSLLHPGELRDLAEEGHEIGLHGWIHEVNSRLDHAIARDLMFRAADTLERLPASVRWGCVRRPGITAQHAGHRARAWPRLRQFAVRG